MQRFSSNPGSRVYRHDRCDTETGVAGGDFFDLCNPLQIVTTTYCCGCGTTVGLDEVRWIDTEEDLSTYRRRLLRSVPTVFRWAHSKWWIVGCLAVATVGAGIAMIAVPGNELAWKIPGMAALAFGMGIPLIADAWIWFAKYTDVV